MPKNDLNVTLKGIDELLFSTEEQRQEEKREQVQQIPIDELYPFTNHTAKTIDTMSKKIDHIDDTVSGFFSFMHMVMQNELGNAEPYFAAVSPVLDLTVIRPDDAPHILPCFDEADEGIGISEDEPLGFRYNPKQVIKLMGKRYLIGPVIFHRFDDDGNFASLTMSDMYTIQKYLESNSVTLMIDRDKLTCICID